MFMILCNYVYIYIDNCSMGIIFSNVNSIDPAVVHLLQEFMASHVTEMVDTRTASTMNYWERKGIYQYIYKKKKHTIFKPFSYHFHILARDVQVEPWDSASFTWHGGPVMFLDPTTRVSWRKKNT